MLKKFGKWYLYALGAFAVFAMIAGLSGATEPDAQFKRAQQSNDTALMKKISDRNPDLIIGGEKASTIVTRLEEKQKAEAEKIAKEKAEAEKIAKEKAETERLKKEKLAKELAIAKSNGYNSYAEYQKAEAKKIAKKKAEAERLAKEKYIIKNNKYIQQYKTKKFITGINYSGPLSALEINKFKLYVYTENNVLYQLISEDNNGNKQVMPLDNTAKIKIVQNSDGTYLTRIGFYKNEWWKNRMYFNGGELGSYDSMRLRFKTKKDAEELAEFLRYLIKNYK